MNELEMPLPIDLQHNDTPVSSLPSISVCDTQPLVIEGIRGLLSQVYDLRFGTALDSLMQATEWATRSSCKNEEAQVLVLDKAYGYQTILGWLTEWKNSSSSDTKLRIVVSAASISAEEALRFMQAGARGILKKTADLSSTLCCLRTVAAEGYWAQSYPSRAASDRPRRSPKDLTSREEQVFELVKMGMKNKDIASELSISPGTVKIHLKHISEKVGVRGRFALALTGISNAGFPTERIPLG